MDFDRNAFLTGYSAAYSLPSGPKAGLIQILDSLAADPTITDLRWAAYMLATIKHECADVWHPIEEFGKGKGRPYGVPVTMTDATGHQFTNVYYGRGYVQLTWKANYQALGHDLGIGDDLMLHPEKALASDLAYQIMSYGMRMGSFTGRKLGTFIAGPTCNYDDAREIINGHDCSHTIAGYAQTIEKLLRSASVPAVGP
jgi:hypothetical protein